MIQTEEKSHIDTDSQTTLLEFQEGESQTDVNKKSEEVQTVREHLQIDSSLSTHMVMSLKSEDFKSESHQISLEPKVSKSTTASLSQPRTKTSTSHSQTLIASAEIECQTNEIVEKEPIQQTTTEVQTNRLKTEDTGTG